MTHILRITDESSYGDKKATVHFLTIPNQEATFALQMLERFGLIAGRDNGEDSTGRAKGELLPVAETVDRAFALSKGAFRHMREAGMLIEMPDPNTINAAQDAKRASKRAAENVA